MFKNILYIFRQTNTKLSKLALGEFLHGFFIAVPTGMLLLIIWELFTANPDTQKIIRILIVMTALFLGQLYVAKRIKVQTSVSIYSMGSKLRILLGNQLQRLSLGFYKKRDPGDLASVVLQDVSNFETILAHSIENIFGSIFGTIFLSSFLFVMDWRLALLMISALPVAFLFVWIATIVSESFSARQIASRNETGSRFIEYIQGIRHLKAYNQTGNKFSTLKKAFNDLRRNSIKLEAVPGPFIITAFIIFEFFFLFMVYVGILEINSETLSVQAFTAFLIVGYRLYEPLKLLMIDYAMLRYMNVSLKRIIDLMKSPLQSEGQNLKPQSSDIEFKDVTFSYVDREIFSNISFSIPEKSLTALVGASGSGKTSIANLIARFWDVQKGQVLIGDVDVKDMNPETVYSLISEVFQEVYLFDDSIYNNIKIGNPAATEQEILTAAKKAQVMEFLDMLPNGIHTKVGEGGSHLSGGQKQRVSIARAMLKNAPIVLLDEATASLDPENEIYIQLAIQELVKEKTVVVIAHKLQTVRNANKIIVLENGQVKEEGTHNELLKHGNLYANYWNTQQSTRGWKSQTRPERTFENINNSIKNQL